MTLLISVLNFDFDFRVITVARNRIFPEANFGDVRLRVIEFHTLF